MTLGLLQQEASYGYAVPVRGDLHVAGYGLRRDGAGAGAPDLSRTQRSTTKAQIYETGETTVTDPWRPFPVRYYVFALLFLIFDVEAAFLYPWAVIYRDLGVYGFVEMVIFVLILAVGLAYAWKKGALKWV